MKVRKFFNILSILCIVTLTPFLVLTRISRFYTAQFDSLNVWLEFPHLQKDFLLSRFQQVLDFINLHQRTLDSSFFSREDIKHLIDVRLILTIMSIIVIVSITWCFFQYKNLELRKELIFSTKHVLFILLGIIGIIGFAGAINFHRLFILFHEIVFWNEYWLLDPRTSNLIKFLPEFIFYRVFLAYITILAAELVGLGIIYYKSKILYLNS